MKAYSFISQPIILILALFFSLPTARSYNAGRETTDEEPILVWIDYGDQAQLNQFAQVIDIWEIDRDRNLALAYLKPEEVQRLIADGHIVSLDEQLTSLLQQEIQALPGQINGIPGFPCYRTVEETYASMESLAASYPHLAARVDIGDSWEKWSTSGSQGYDIFSLVLTNKTTAGPKPKLLILAAIHAREYVTAELAARFAEYLVEKYGQDADITWLLDYSEIHIIPISNPDGRKIAEEGIYWRKNVNYTDGCTNPSMWGTDLNRNSSFKWGVVGTSPHACNETFLGSAPASESETLAIQSYMSGLFPDRRGPADSDPAPGDTSGIFITLHSYGNLILYPWSWTEFPAPNYSSLQTLGRKFGYYSGYQVCQAGETGCMYQTSGTTDDWAYGQLGIAGYTFELGSTFFESCSYFEQQIFQNQIPTLLYASKAARLPYQVPAGPESINLSASADRIAAGAGLKVSFQADDTRYASSGWGLEPAQPIATARYSLDAPSWQNQDGLIYIQPADERFDASIENFSMKIDTHNLSPGRHTIFVESQDAAGNYGVPSAVFIDIVAEEYQAHIEPTVQSSSGSRATILAYDILVRNNGTQDDSFDLQIMGNTWQTILSQQSAGPLIPGESTPVAVKVYIPDAAEVGEQDMVIILVTSKADPSQFSQATITTTSRIPMLFIPNMAK